MNKRYIKAIMFGVVTAIMLGVLSLLSGCSFSFFDDGGVRELTDNGINFRYDYQTDELSWEHVEGVERYRLEVLTTSDEYMSIFYTANAQPDSDTGRMSIRADELMDWKDRLGNKIDIVLTAMGDSPDDVVYKRRLKANFLAIGEISIDAFNGSFEWDDVVGADEYIVSFSGQEVRVTQSQFIVRDYLDSPSTNFFYITPVSHGEELWVSYQSDMVKATESVSPINLRYKSGTLWWDNGYTQSQYSGLRITEDLVDYVVRIWDGGEPQTVHCTGATYDYTPKSENFSFGVSQYVNNNSSLNYVVSDEVTFAPEYLGKVDGFALDTRLNEFVWNGELSNSYLMYLDGVSIGSALTENCISVDKFSSKYGVKDITICPVTDTNEYALPATFSVRFGDYPTVIAEHLGDGRVKFNVRAFGDALSCKVVGSSLEEAFEPIDLNLQLENDNVDFEMQCLDVENLVRYGFKFTFVYPDDGAILVERTKNFSVARDGVPTVAEFSSYSGGASVKFNGGSTTELVCEGSSDVERISSYVKWYLPEEFVSARGENSLTVSVRSISSYGLTDLHIPSVWKELTFKTTPSPTNLDVEESQLSWSYDGEAPIDNYIVYNNSNWTAETQNWLIPTLTTGTYYLDVVAIPDNGDAEQTGVWYLRSLPSEEYRITVLAPVGGYATNGNSGVSWTASEGAEEYAVTLTGEGYSETLTLTDCTIDFADRLKVCPEITVKVIPIGDHTVTMDGAESSFVATTNPGFTYAIDNQSAYGSKYGSENSTVYESKLFFEFADENAQLDFALYTPAGNLIEERLATTSRETEWFYASTVGAYNLSINAPAAEISPNRFYLKTGDDSIDWVDKTIYKMYVTAEVDGRDLIVRSVPALTNKTYWLNVQVSNLKTVGFSSTTGEWRVDGDTWKGIVPTTAVKKIYFNVSLGVTDSEELLLIYNYEGEGEIQFDYVQATTPTLGFTDYAPKSTHYLATADGKRENASHLNTNAFVRVVPTSTGGWARAYTYKVYDSSGALVSTRTSEEPSSVFELPEYYTISAIAESWGFAERDGQILVLYSSTECEASEPVTEVFMYGESWKMENGILTITISYPHGNEVAQVWIDGQNEQNLTSQKVDDNTCAFTYEPNLSSGEQFTICLYREGVVEKGTFDGAKIYLIFTMP
ncbi:MAG: hypothetical protein IKC64_00390 [Clostridia bacterium]|nr:hypothetical protein [Clostridia bacterium]